MNNSCKAFLLVLVGGVAAAQQRLPSVTVTYSGSEQFVTVACSAPEAITSDDAQRVLDVKDVAQIRGLRTKLIGAASEACAAKVPKILVSRTASGGSLTWKAAD